MLAVAMIALVLAAMARRVSFQPVKATSPVPELAARQEKVVHGVEWSMSYEEARENAEREQRPILIYFAGVNDANGRMMEGGVLPRGDVVPLLARFVTVQLFTDYAPIVSLTREQRAEIAIENQELLINLTNESTVPLFAVVDAQGKLVAAQGGVCSASQLISFLETAESAYHQRTGSSGHGRWELWVFRAILIPALGFIAIWALIRLKNKPCGDARRARFGP
jgi:thiol:disulfide interchange protein DsbD